tara:strand:+ start:1196 stop:2617 length:1422 start_codon:yes stop_codon:yes gene_type:complete
MINNFLSKFKYLIGPIAFLAILMAPLNVEIHVKQFLAIFMMVVCLWLFTSVPLFISGILGVSLTVILGIETAKEAFAPFADPIIFLFLGGFLLAKALENTELDKRLAYKALSLPWAQKSPSRIVLMFIGLGFVLSMWISNTATVAMLLPLSFGVIQKLKTSFGIDDHKFNEQLLLAMAFSATVGGSVTPIGSPPNIIAIGLLNNLTGSSIGFLQWIIMSLPICLIIFFYIFKRCISHLPKTLDLNIKEEINDYREFSPKQKRVLIIFGLTVFFWIIPSLVSLVLSSESSLTQFLSNNISAPVVAIFFSSLLFLLPLNSSEKILTSDQMSNIDWPSLLLFGSGLSLGKILFKTGLVSYFVDIASTMSIHIGVLSMIVLLLFLTIMFTEVASNTASANIIIPIMIAFSQEMNLNSATVAFLFALACNSAFMLPVATPPNTIIYGTKRVNKLTMIKSGLGVNIVSAILLSIFMLVF